MAAGAPWDLPVAEIHTYISIVVPLAMSSSLCGMQVEGACWALLEAATHT